MGTPEDMKRRMQQAAIAFRRMHALWLRKDHVSIDRRVRLYKAFVLPALLYNCCTWGAIKACMDRLDAFHRRQLRSLLGIRYPARISNAALYKKCHSSPISETISQRRLTMLGHTLRLTEDTPPQQAMRLYFHPPSTAKPGRPQTTLVTELQRDCRTRHKQLKTNEHLSSLRFQSQDRGTWRSLIYKGQYPHLKVSY